MAVDDPILLDLLIAYLRPPAYWDATAAPVFEPPLTTEEQTALADLRQMATLGLQTLTLDGYRARKADIDGIRAYMALPSPTAAQTQAAFKALVRVVAAMLRLQLNG